MFIFAAVLLLYALALRSGNYKLILRNYATKPKDKIAYTKAVGKIIAMTAVAPVLSGVIYSLTESFALAMIALITAGASALIIGVKKVKT